MRHWFVLLSGLCLLVGCGGAPTPTPDLVATQIAIEKAAHATMTAEVPTMAYTSTSTPVASVTPQPIEPTQPSPTSQAPTSTSMLSPTRTATPTLVPTRTATPTLVPPPTPTPTPTLEPPTETPSPTPPACTLAPGGVFYPIWQQVKNRLGCPTNLLHGTWSAVERFERGWMYWREDADRIYVMYDDGFWQDLPDLWQEGEPETVGLNPPPGRLEPKRGFGKVWRLNLGGPSAAIGWATEEERGIDSQIQDFAAGTMLVVEGQTYVFFRDGWSWTQW